MKMELLTALLYGLLVGQAADAQEGSNQYPRWVIVATIIELHCRH